MKDFSWIRAILSGLIGLVIAVVIAAIVSPVENLARTLIVACLPALLSAVSGYSVGARQKRKIIADGSSTDARVK